VVNIVYLEEKAQFDPSVIKSHFTHVFIVVQKLYLEAGYRVVIVSNRDVPKFGPFLPADGIFPNLKELQRFLIPKSKLVFAIQILIMVIVLKILNSDQCGIISLQSSCI
jgi:hypothetical protein